MEYRRNTVIIESLAISEESLQFAQGCPLVTDWVYEQSVPTAEGSPASDWLIRQLRHAVQETGSVLRGAVKLRHVELVHRQRSAWAQAGVSRWLPLPPGQA